MVSARAPSGPRTPACGFYEKFGLTTRSVPDNKACECGAERKRRAVDRVG